MSEKIKKFHFYGIFVWSIAILFYLYEFFLRVVPATFSKEILVELDISMNQFSLISSAYYITYSMMQIPVGILIDRYGPRLLSGFACVICTLGIIGFAYSDHFYSAIISRLLIGIGSSFGFITLLVFALNWFPREHFGFLSGLGQAIGAAGPLIAGAPVVFLFHFLHNSLQSLFLWISVYGGILSVIMFSFLKNSPPRKEEEVVVVERRKSLKHDLKVLIKIPQVWISMLYTGAVYVSLPMLGAYWGTLYLEARGFSKTTSGFMISLVWIGLALGSPLFGKISDRMKRRKPVLAFLGIIGIVSTMALLFSPIKSEWVLSLVLIFIGIAGGGQSLAFAYITEHVPLELKATALAMNNTAVMLIASLLPPIATYIIQAQIGSQKTYLQSDFTAGFLFMPGAFLFALLVCTLFMKETFGRPQDSIHPINLP